MEEKQGIQALFDRKLRVKCKVAQSLPQSVLIESLKYCFNKITE